MEINTSVPEQEQNPEPKKKNKKLIIGIAIVAIVLITAGLFYQYTSSKKNTVNTDSLKCDLTQTDIYEKYKDAVVLIRHEYLYEVTINNQKPILFTWDATNGFYPYQEGYDAIAIYGTGFFIDNKGKIATNRHVLAPWELEGQTGMPYTDYFEETIRYRIPVDIADSEIAAHLKAHWFDDVEYNEEGSENEDVQDSTQTDSAQTAMNEPPKVEEGTLKFEGSITIRPVSKYVGIALHGWKNLEHKDLIPCKISKVSDDKDIDVGILVTKKRNTPKTVKNTIDLEMALLDDEELKPGNKVFMIGYPMGLQLGQTSRGLLVQSYQGTINKESDGKDLQYDITSTHGASGSPVFDSCGRLVAVNFAGYDQTQGFNFGIVAKHLINLNDQ